MEKEIHLYDYIVIGLGAHGSSILYQLSKVSKNVLGLEQFDIHHKNGSSHGDTRIIRQAYFEGDFYIPFLKRAYELWDELEEKAKEQVFYKVGCLNARKENLKSEIDIVKNSKQGCDKHGIRYELFDDSEEINKKFEFFNFPTENENYTALYEYQAGYLLADDCNRIHINLAKENGVNILFNSKIKKILREENLNYYKIILESNEIYHTEKLVLSCGSWINEILIENFGFQLPLTVDLNHVFYYKIKNNATKNSNFIDEKTPVYIIQVDEDLEYYGFPNLENGNHYKISIYHQGICFNKPDEVERNTKFEDSKSKVNKFGKKFIKDFSEENVELIKSLTCLYTTTPDCNFIIDYIPNSNEKIVVSSACSGHGFKFASFVGEHVKQLLNNEIKPYNKFMIKRFSNDV